MTAGAIFQQLHRHHVPSPPGSLAVMALQRAYSDGPERPVLHRKFVLSLFSHYVKLG